MRTESKIGEVITHCQGDGESKIGDLVFVTYDQRTGYAIQPFPVVRANKNRVIFRGEISAYNNVWKYARGVGRLVDQPGLGAGLQLLDDDDPAVVEFARQHGITL